MATTVEQSRVEYRLEEERLYLSLNIQVYSTTDFYSSVFLSFSISQLVEKLVLDPKRTLKKTCSRGSSLDLNPRPFGYNLKALLTRSPWSMLLTTNVHIYTWNALN